MRTNQVPPRSNLDSKGRIASGKDGATFDESRELDRARPLQRVPLNRSIALGPVKSVARAALPEGHPGREVILVLPDEMPNRDFDVIIPTLLRLLRTRVEPRLFPPLEP